MPTVTLWCSILPIRWTGHRFDSRRSRGRPGANNKQIQTYFKLIQTGTVKSFLVLFELWVKEEKKKWSWSRCFFTLNILMQLTSLFYWMVSERRSVFKIDNCVCCCNLYMAVISVVNVFFLRKHKNKRWRWAWDVLSSLEKIYLLM